MFPITRILLSAALVLPAVAPAQELPQATPPPAPIPSAVPTPAPTVAAPVPTPTPEATPTADPAAIVPSPTATPSPRATRTPTTPGPEATSAPVPPAPGPTPTPEPQPAIAVPAPEAAIVAPVPVTEATQDDAPLWPWALGGALVLLGGIGLWVARRRRPGAGEEYDAPIEEFEASPVVGPAPAPRLVLAFRPTRAGFNMLSATVEGELEIANAGDAAGEGIRVRTVLLSAHVGQAAELDAFHAEPAGRLAVPPFALAPGERRTVRLVAAAAREGLRTMTAGGRPMFVPIFGIDVRADGGGQVAQAFAIGIERVDSAKLAPFWLDVPPRSYTEVAARPHGAAIERSG